MTPELRKAYTDALDRALQAGGGAGGLDEQGNIAMSYTGDGMYRGFAKQDGQAHIFIYEDEA